DDQRGRRVGEACPVKIERSITTAMAGDVTHPGRQSAVGERHPGGGGTALGGGYPRDHLDRDAGTIERSRLLATAPEDEGIAALEAHDVAPAAGEPHHQAID